MIWTADLDAAARAHAQETYPAECCGLLLAPGAGPDTGAEAEAPTAAIYRRCDNTQRQDPALDPDGAARGAETAFHLDGGQIVRAEREGFEIRGIVHSHPDHDAYFSAMDRQVATWQLGDDLPPEPAYPGVSYLVISVRAGVAGDQRWFLWDDGAGDFVQGVAP